MIRELYVLYDNLAQECGNVLHAKNDVVMLREFEKKMAELPAFDKDELTLYKVGQIDSETMQITPIKPEVVKWTGKILDEGDKQNGSTL